MNDKKNLYFITPNKENNFYEQLEWIDDIFKKEQHYVFNSDFKVFKAREIYSYVKRKEIENSNTIINKCVILDESGKYTNKVLICPIYPKSASENKFGINIGKICYLGDDEEYIAALAEIKYVSKARFRINGKKISESFSFGNLDTNSYLRILESYKRVIQTIIDKTSDYHTHLLSGQRILSA